ncbi:beta strand repeat-containing protein [Rubrimonas cliftonensis]|uniref:Uncharacterized protein n=1 Tax=Rubrimonas cliftonensis TaxID=89524 RepID=A0A1H4GEG7_9RHOB|nr:hypothetical protein [Rubrimonas cliftonensis]SEB07390.1 hypothetical protein SAMN05444370_1533 [Rubrimonas cliftonensis]
MTDIIINPLGVTTPQTTTDPGDTIVVHFGALVGTITDTAVTLADDDTTLANSGEIRSLRGTAVSILGNNVTVLNDRDIAEELVGPPPPLPPLSGTLVIGPPAPPPPPSGGLVVIGDANDTAGAFRPRESSRDVEELRDLPRGSEALLDFPGLIGPEGLSDVEFSQPFPIDGPIAGPVINGVVGIRVEGENASIVNFGEISGDVTAVDFVNGGESSGTLENFGLITSFSRAVNIGGDGITLFNNGRIETTGDPRNGVVYTDVTSNNFTIINELDITSPEGGTGDAISVELGENVFGDILNTVGLIQGRGEASGIWIYSPTGGPSTFTTLIENGGGIIAESTTGIDAAIRFDDGVSFVGEIRNLAETSGIIEGVRNAIRFGEGDHSEGVIVNEENATITAVSRAIDIAGVGLTIKNDGDITTTGDARNGVIYATASATGYRIENGETGRIGAASVVLNNSHAISFELDDAVEGSIYNAGFIDAGGQGSGVRLFSANPETGSRFTGEIENRNEIISQADVGVNAAILVEDGVGFHGTISNSGFIFGVRNGVYLGDGDHALTLLNEVGGLIASESRALNIDGTGVSVVNHGEIVGFGDSRNGVVYSDVTADDFSILNTGSIDAGMDFNGVSFNADAISLQLGAVVNATIVNHGEINGRGEATGSGEASGVRLFSGVEGPSVFVGDIVNTGAIHSEATAAILIQQGVRVSGEIVNAGLLSAPIALDARESDFGLTFRQTDGVTDGRLLFGDGNDVVLIEGGAVLGEIDLGGGLNVFDGTGALSSLAVFGGRDRDRIIGGAGDDEIDAGGGRDVATGGEGADSFFFASSLIDDGRRDLLRITDFDVTEDAFIADLSRVASAFAVGNSLILTFDGADRDVVLFQNVADARTLFDDLLSA